MKRWLSILLCAVLLVSLSGCGTFSDTVHLLQSDLRPAAPRASIPFIDPLIETPFTPCQTTFYYDRLPNEKTRLLYETLLYHLAGDSQDSLYIKGEFSREDVVEALRAVQYDYPQMLCAPWGQQCKYYTDVNGKVHGIELYFSEVPTERIAYRKTVCEALSAQLREAARYDDPFERELFLYDSLIRSTDYDYAAAQTSTTVDSTALATLSLENRLAHTPYGALVRGSAVCDGYACAFQLLCNYAGIEAATMIGSASADGLSSSAPTGDNHAWNLVTLGEKHYYCDPTWDDNGNMFLDAAGTPVEAPFNTQTMRELNVPVLHRYFNLCYDEIAYNHRFATGFSYPTGTANAENYFVHRGLTVSSPDELLDLAKAAQAQRPGTSLALEFRLLFQPEDVSELFTTCFSQLSDFSAMFSSTTENGTGSYFVYLYSQ